MTSLTIESASEDCTVEIGRAMAGVLKAGDVIALDGPLGAGKTRLVRGLAAGLGIDPSRVSSPTYVIAHEYSGAGTAGVPLRHLDAYRLGGPDDLESVGWDRIDDGNGIVVIEWAERIVSGLRRCHATVRIDPTAATGRTLLICVPDDWTTRPGWKSLARLALPKHRGIDRHPTDESAIEPHGPAAGSTLRCPTCKVPVSARAGTVPFCSDRCRMADLGRWFSGGYTIAREIMPEDADDPDLMPPHQSSAGPTRT